MVKLGYGYSYHGKCIGRLTHFLNNYCNLHIAEIACFGDGKVELYGKPFATFTWDEGHEDIPTFVFIGENAEYYNEQQSKMKIHLLQMETYEHLYSNIQKRLTSMITVARAVVNDPSTENVVLLKKALEP